MSVIALSLPSVTISSRASATIFFAFFSFSCSGGRNLPSTKSVILSGAGRLSLPEGVAPEMPTRTRTYSLVLSAFSIDLTPLCPPAELPNETLTLPSGRASSSCTTIKFLALPTAFFIAGPELFMYTLRSTTLAEGIFEASAATSSLPTLCRVLAYSAVGLPSPTIVHFILTLISYRIQYLHAAGEQWEFFHRAPQIRTHCRRDSLPYPAFCRATVHCLGRVDGADLPQQPIPHRRRALLPV